MLGVSTLRVSRPQKQRPAETTRGFRPDVQGLRALAVSLVVLYHLYPTKLPGGYIGVDVFFVISGFLITGHIARTQEKTGRVGLVDFYARRARRLMPAAALVLAVTWFASLLLLPVTQLPDTARQIRASALYFQNWTLAQDAVSYLKSDDAATPVQHFWSLSVEEQFYVVWPLLFVIAGALAWAIGRRLRLSARTVMTVLAAGVVAASLWYSVHETAFNPAAAYFVTPTRMWELGLGGLLALLPYRLTQLIGRLGPLSWVGFAMIVWSAVELTGATAFPGWIALIPVGGAVLMIATGSSRGWLSTSPLASLRPVVFLGDISYSLYLWHWPIIVLWKSARPGPGLPTASAVVIVAASVLLSWLSKVFVEDKVRLAPFFAQHKWRSLATVAVAGVPVLAVLVWLSQQPGPWQAHVDAAHPGAAVLAGDASPKKVDAVPPLVSASTDYEVASGDDCQAAPSATKVITCTFGDTTAPVKTVALVGDSVAGQWSSALAQVAEKRHWKLIAITHSSCPWTATLMTQTGHSSPYTVCQQWGRSVLSMLTGDIKPDVVITSDRPTNGVPGQPHSNPSTRAEIGAGMVTYWNQLAQQDIPVVAIKESPEMGVDIPTCLAARTNSESDCTVAAADAIYSNTALQTATAAVPSSTLIDLNNLICSDACQPVVGNVVVYRDTHHLTETYTLSLEPYLAEQLDKSGAFG